MWRGHRGNLEGEAAHPLVGVAVPYSVPLYPHQGREDHKAKMRNKTYTTRPPNFLFLDYCRYRARTWRARSFIAIIIGEASLI